ncbi:S8 family serine peptidase [Streptomonospora wellingtoniae]|uniref:S8 family serine peptidase n=1 Tax=Streptomonospora wellingtoniae TaxID=3075544 RepID=A0ABU2KZH0_9ACTN|nr:S8 family serine peptidase [Streptomonospora sp. DSM 45055]MDT0304700.1 S8 family serine peptidase [Streptomonospora sp. DSM 45055]
MRRYRALLSAPRTFPAPAAAASRGRAIAAAAVAALLLGTAPPAAAASQQDSPPPEGASAQASPSGEAESSSGSASGNPQALPQVAEFAGADAACVQSSSAEVSRTPWTEVSLGLEEARGMSEGSGVTVAVLAPAVAADGPALSDAVSGGSGEDCRGYGTLLAGIVAARPVAGSGFTGVAPAAEVVAVPTGDARTGAVTSGEIASSIGEAVEAGADVVLVGTAAWEAGAALSDAVADAAAADALVVAPATTAPQGESLPGYPAQDPAVLSVGSYGPDGAPLLSSPLPLGEGGQTARTDVTAPGAQVMGVGPGGGHYVGGGDGTAAAFAAGTAALVRAREPGLSAEKVRRRLTATALGAVLGAGADTVGRGPIDPAGALTGSPQAPEAPAAEGARFAAAPPAEGTWDRPVTTAVAGGAAFLIVLCALGAVVLRKGRARAWRPAAAGERISPDDAEGVGPGPEPR